MSISRLKLTKIGIWQGIIRRSVRRDMQFALCLERQNHIIEGKKYVISAEKQIETPLIPYHLF